MHPSVFQSCSWGTSAERRHNWLWCPLPRARAGQVEGGGEPHAGADGKRRRAGLAERQAAPPSTISPRNEVGRRLRDALPGVLETGLWSPQKAKTRSCIRLGFSREKSLQIPERDLL